MNHQQPYGRFPSDVPYPYDYQNPQPQFQYPAPPPIAPQHITQQQVGHQQHFFQGFPQVPTPEQQQPGTQQQQQPQHHLQQLQLHQQHQQQQSQQHQQHQQQQQQQPQDQLPQVTNSPVQPRAPKPRAKRKPPVNQNNAQQGSVQIPGALPVGSTPNDIEAQLMTALQDGPRSQQVTNANRTEDNEEEEEEDANADENEPVFSIPPPPEGVYPNEAELEKSMHAWSLEHGYEMVRRSTKKNANGVLYKRYYHCSKHGKASNSRGLTSATRVRAGRVSIRSGCPMSIAAVAVDPQNPDGDWQIRHRKTHHNHAPIDAVHLTGHRRRARLGAVEKAVDGLFAIGTPTGQVLQFLQRTNPGGLFTKTDVANMKLKYKKHGSCAHDTWTKSIDHRSPACDMCREKKSRCDRARPSCAACMGSGLACVYRAEAQPQPGDSNDIGDLEGELALLDDGVETTPARQRQDTRPIDISATQQILADLQSYQAEHVKPPARLTVQSSQVEILAHSSCGNGDSYKNVPFLQSDTDWQTYSDSMLEAAMKENTHEVLSGAKAEPTKPDDDCDVEEWNEYIKQLAIFRRRNSALLGAIWGSLAPHFRTRIQGLNIADAVWQTLEDICRPRGSFLAFNKYSDLCSISLATSSSLKDYISRLENGYESLRQLKVSNPLPRPKSHVASSNASLARQLFPPSTQTSQAASTANRIDGAVAQSHLFSEEALCFHFLRNLGPEYQRWVEDICSTNNIAGFGTGPRTDFSELAKRALEREAMMRRQR